jgi:hypothetical protein
MRISVPLAFELKMKCVVHRSQFGYICWRSHLQQVQHCCEGDLLLRRVNIHSHTSYSLFHHHVVHS